MDIKKLVVVGVLAVAASAGGYGVYQKFLKAKETTVSVLKGKPDDFLGKVVVTGRSGKVYPDKSVIEMVDDKGCCNIFLFVPQNESQQKEFQQKALYRGELPQPGQPLTVKGTLVKTGEAYAFEVEEVTGSGKTFMTRI